MTHPFKVSDKVICQDNSDGPIYMPGPRLELNQIYVISETTFFGKIPAVKVTGRCPDFTEHGQKYETFYKASRFRKLDDIKEENRMKESRSEGILHHRRKLQPIVLRDDTTTHQDKVNAARDHVLLRLLEAMDCGMKTLKGGIRNE